VLLGGDNQLFIFQIPNRTLSITSGQHGQVGDHLAEPIFWACLAQFFQETQNIFARSIDRGKKSPMVD
jgi:hypothetical protein